MKDTNSISLDVFESLKKIGDEVEKLRRSVEEKAEAYPEDEKEDLLSLSDALVDISFDFAESVSKAEDSILLYVCHAPGEPYKGWCLPMTEWRKILLPTFGFSEREEARMKANMGAFMFRMESFSVTFELVTR